jgi:hypothetical protein
MAVVRSLKTYIAESSGSVKTRGTEFKFTRYDTAARVDNHHANLQAELHAKQNHEKVCAKLTKLEVLK